MNKFERPKFKVSDYVESENYGKFVISPLERGFGTTLGNALRRTMLSSLPGGAVYSIKVDGVFHEFSSIKGVKEDIAAFQLNTVISKIRELVGAINRLGQEKIWDIKRFSGALPTQTGTTRSSPTKTRRLTSFFRAFTTAPWCCCIPPPKRTPKSLTTC